VDFNLGFVTAVCQTEEIQWQKFEFWMTVWIGYTTHARCYMCANVSN